MITNSPLSFGRIKREELQAIKFVIFFKLILYSQFVPSSPLQFISSIFTRWTWNENVEYHTECYAVKAIFLILFIFVLKMMCAIQSYSTAYQDCV